MTVKLSFLPDTNDNDFDVRRLFESVVLKKTIIPKKATDAPISSIGSLKASFVWNNWLAIQPYYTIRTKTTGRIWDWKLLQAGSRFLSDAKTRYPMIELECLEAT